jgi:predicted SprT family Zn-dependent metalloprotease
MNLTFDCDCGTELSSYTRGDDEVKVQYRCDGCGTVYAVTITPLEGPYA